MKRLYQIERIPTGVHNLDALLGGGLPKGTVTILAGNPGAGKTTLAHQICFHNASLTQKVLVFQTLSEPAAKTIKYMSGFDFFDSTKLDTCIEYIDLGAILRADGLTLALTSLLEHIKRVQPALVMIDSFKVFEDLADSRQDLRKFVYEVAVTLMAWEITALLTGEYSMDGIAAGPLFSVVDGIFSMTSRDASAESQRILSIVKMRGTRHDRFSHPYLICQSGIEIFNSRMVIPERPVTKSDDLKVIRVKTGIAGLDEIMEGGLPLSSLTLISGVSGSGKTLLVLESLFRGAEEFNEKGIFFSFELTQTELFIQAAALGLDLATMVHKKMVEIVFIPPSQIMIEKNIEMIQERTNKFGAKRVGIDSLSVFLERIKQPHLVREKIVQLSDIIKSASAIGLVIMTTPFGDPKLMGPDTGHSVADAIILITSPLEAAGRPRFLEIVKMRSTNYARGRHHFEIQKGGTVVRNRPLATKKRKARQR